VAVKVREEKIERELVRRVTQLGGKCLKVTVLGRRGFADRLVVLPNKPMQLVELKRPKGGRVSVHQDLWHREMISLGVAIALVKDSADIDELLT
jgi:Holliday junction resolvase